MRQVARWGLISAATAPVALIGGWTLAAARQAGGFDSVTETISALAAHGATDRWLMTSALAILGGCHLGTAAALRPAGRTGRAILAFGGAATLGVAAFPLPETGSSTAHKVVAGLAFGALAVWPLGAAVRKPVAEAGAEPMSEAGAEPVSEAESGTAAAAGVSWALRPRASVIASGTLLALVGWFVVSQQHDVAVGLAERAAAGAQALWPLAVVASSLRHQRR